MSSLRLPWLAAFVTIAFANGCIQDSKPEPLTNARAAAILDEIVFNPTISCAELREVFDVSHLPLADTPADAGINYLEFYVNTFDNNLLRVWYLPALQERGVVLLSTGAAGTMPCYLFISRILVANGWSVILYDYRGFGGSSGTPQVFALSADLEAVLDWALEFTGREEVSLMGISLGTIPSVAVASRRPEVINGVILDSAVSLSIEATRFGKLLGSLGEQIADLLPIDLRTEDQITVMFTPALFFKNTKDFLTPPSMVQLLFDRAPGAKTLVTFDGVGHARGVFRDTEEYVIALEQFLVGVWGQTAIPVTVAVPPTE